MNPYPGPYGGQDPADAWNQGGVPDPMPPDKSATGGYFAPLPAVSETPIAVLGEITVTQSTVYTPAGTFPLRGSMWTINDLTTVRESTPAWAIVVALLGFFVICALSLLLLLVKETRVEGTIQITVVFGDRFFTTQVPVRSRSDVVRIHQQFHYVRSLTC
ncbi:hypothetical protein Tfu_2225 [Thermobifida fusca YX]|uniref:Uncharacterized protein n=2 Tax=Thermobifida fusca TaxID=2021 RepID=Q47MR2_THEFY|nr:hypothetical protein Tfu_2225 [Thermobifida fusca YX]